MVFGRAVPGMPGHQLIDFWGADKTMSFPDDGARPKYETLFPGGSGFRFIEVLLPPRQSGDVVTQADPSVDPFPDFNAVLDETREGLHRTESIDMVYVIAGRCELVLGDTTIALEAGNAVVQSGTMHLWNNPGDQPCRLLLVLIGAEQAQ
jgi:mannose-6-phosphate isomerase-like protein (cupin superfamily)